MFGFLKSGFKYTKSFFSNPEKKDKNIWTSGMLLFHDGERLRIDYSFIIVGNIPKHYLSYYVNFNNWSIICKKLYYIGGEEAVKVYPENVYLYLKTGIIPFSKKEIFKNPTHWNNFVSNPDDKIFNMVKNQLSYKKPKIIDLSYEFPYKKKIHNKLREMNHPMFNRIRYCGDDRIIFSQLCYLSLLS